MPYEPNVHPTLREHMPPNPQTGASPESAALATCQGQPAPAPVREGWETLLSLPTSALQAFGELFTATVTETDEEALGLAVTSFSSQYGLDSQAVVDSIRACQFLLRQAAMLDLDAGTFASDLTKLSGEETGPIRLFTARYTPLKARVREGLLLQTLMDHGKVLVDLDWRVDRVSASSRLAGPTSDVVILTLGLQSTAGSERVTMQLPTQSLKLLQDFCARFTPQR